ncbi:MAG: hypothetical protein ACRDTV_14650, partial [Mycobacterium sp.]
GFSGIHTMVPMRKPEQPEQTVHTTEHFAHSRATAAGEVSVAEEAAHIPELVYPFFWEDVPADIVEADRRGGYPIRTIAPRFGSATIPNCAVAMLSRGYIKAEAAEVDVPVFLGLGERDIAVEPHREPTAYSRSTDVSLFICDRMAHMHNFASTRQKLWDRLAHWCTVVVARRHTRVTSNSSRLLPDAGTVSPHAIHTSGWRASSTR